MVLEPHSTVFAPAAIGPYSQTMRARSMFLFMSCQIPLTASGELVTGSIQEQTTQVIANMKAVLESAGMDFSHIVKTTIFLSSMDHFAAVNEIYGAAFSENPPARSTVAVAGLPKGVDVEIEAIAVY